MKLRAVWVGKTQNLQLAKLCSDYISRIKHFLPLEIAEIKEPRGGIEAEGERILSVLDASDRAVVLDPKGTAWTSEQLAKFLQQHMTSDSRRLTFVIGGYEGLSDKVKKRSDIQWSLSPLTFTHDLTRVLLLEQLYRALTIIRNLPYSK
jgi:23S rRNA (pseudouridine1915-N3)-methyltransferase